MLVHRHLHPSLDQQRVAAVHRQYTMRCCASKRMDTFDCKSVRRRGLELSVMEGNDVGSNVKTMTAAKNSILGYAVPLRRSGRHR